MQNISVGRYSSPSNVGGWLGWIEPDDMKWILFVHQDEGQHKFYSRRNKNGGVID